VLLDQVQQEIQRPFELLEPDRIRLEDRLEFLLMFHIEIAEGTEVAEEAHSVASIASVDS